MKSILLGLLLIYLVHQIGSENPEKYTTKYDGIDLNEILANDRLLNGYINCLLDLGPCTPDGKELKGNLPDAIDNDCAKCTERQREGADQVMHYIIDHRPADWEKLESKYQSDGSYKSKYMASKKLSEIETTEKPRELKQNGDTEDENQESQK